MARFLLARDAVITAAQRRSLNRRLTVFVKRLKPHELHRGRQEKDLGVEGAAMMERATNAVEETRDLTRLRVYFSSLCPRRGFGADGPRCGGNNPPTNTKNDPDTPHNGIADRGKWRDGAGGEDHPSLLHLNCGIGMDKATIQ